LIPIAIMFVVVVRACWRLAKRCPSSPPGVSKWACRSTRPRLHASAMDRGVCRVHAIRRTGAHPCAAWLPLAKLGPYSRYRRVRPSPGNSCLAQIAQARCL
jgi:hypothetical protein